MKKSEVYKMAVQFCDNIGKGRNITRDGVCRAWSAFWFLLIEHGFEFRKNDLKLLRDIKTGHYYTPRVHMPDEGHYSLSVRCSNLSFVYAYEFLKKRVPFICKNVSYYSCWPGFTNNATQSKRQGRLVLNSEFLWQTFPVKVTSFDDNTNSLIACAYNTKKDWQERDVITKRFTITAEMFRKEMSKRKKDAK